ncbi:MAG TPA: hypothetical protein VJU86_05305 [Pyrinomonadaceae bacterium]|nr:hypothetical protein [Pyrinomonadaceae bacterium]
MKAQLARLGLILATVPMLAIPVAAQSGISGLPVIKSYPMSGRVVDNEGKPARGVRVCAIPENFDENKPNVVIPCGSTGDLGNFLIVAHHSGKFSLHYDQVEQGYWPSRMPFFRHPQYVAPEIVLDPNAQGGPLNISMAPRNGMLIGKSIDVKTGLPLESVEFTLCHVADPKLCRVSVVKTADGSFKLPAPFVPFTLQARAEGFDDWTGLRGHDQTEINLGGGTSLQLQVFLTRKTTDRAIFEREKQPGLHLPAPTQVSPSFGVIFNDYPRKTKIEWSAVEGATSYSVEVDYCECDRNRKGCPTPHPLNLSMNPPMKDIVGTSYEFFFIGAQPGRWRVWAVDKERREGFKSPWSTFVYLR